MTPRRHLNQALGAVLLSPLSGCGVLGRATPPQVFVSFDDQAPPAPAQAPAPLPHTLLIATAASTSLYAGQRLIFTRDGSALAPYYAAQWSEPPLRRMAMLAERRLSSHTGLQAVGASTAGLRGDRLLNLRLDALLHNDTRSPGQMQLDTTAELLDWPRHQLIARRRFQLSAPVTHPHARAAAAGTSVVMTRWLDALSEWVQETLARAPRGGGSSAG